MLTVNKANIWLFKQNKPSLIVEDLVKYGVPETDSFKILLSRGVFKWLSVRRNLIKIKNSWKNILTRFYRNQETLKKSGTMDIYTIGYNKGYIEAMEYCRKEIRSLCHSER